MNWFKDKIIKLINLLFFAESWYIYVSLFLVRHYFLPKVAIISRMLLFLACYYFLHVIISRVSSLVLISYIIFFLYFSHIIIFAKSWFTHASLFSARHYFWHIIISRQRLLRLRIIISDYTQPFTVFLAYHYFSHVIISRTSLFLAKGCYAYASLFFAHHPVHIQKYAYYIFWIYISRTSSSV